MVKSLHTSIYTNLPCAAVKAESQVFLNANVCKNCRNLCYGTGNDAGLQREAAGGVEHLPVLSQGGPRHHHTAQGGRQVSSQMLRGQDCQAGSAGII
jgi:hypothetical protein